MSNTENTEFTLVDSEINDDLDTENFVKDVYPFPNPEICDAASLIADKSHKNAGFSRQTTFFNGVLDMTTTERVVKGLKVVEHSLDLEQAFKLGEKSLELSKQEVKLASPIVVRKFNAKTKTFTFNPFSKVTPESLPNSNLMVNASNDPVTVNSTIIEQKSEELDAKKVQQVQPTQIAPTKIALPKIIVRPVDYQVAKDPIVNTTIDTNEVTNQATTKENSVIAVTESSVVKDETTQAVVQDIPTMVSESVEVGSVVKLSEPELIKPEATILLEHVSQTLANRDDLNTHLFAEMEVPKLDESFLASEQVEKTIAEDLANANNSLAVDNLTEQAITEQVNDKFAEIIENSVTPKGKLTNNDLVDNKQVDSKLIDKEAEVNLEVNSNSESETNLTSDQLATQDPVANQQLEVESNSITDIEVTTNNATDDTSSTEPVTTENTTDDLLAEKTEEVEDGSPISFTEPDANNLDQVSATLGKTVKLFDAQVVTQTLQQQLDNPETKHQQLIPYALVVFGNDAMCLDQCIKSVSAYCDRGVLVYSETPPGMQDDGSVELAEEFVSNNPGFKLLRYPIPVIPQNLTPLMDKLINAAVHRYWLIDCIYNYALLHIHRLAIENQELDRVAVFKVDPEVIYDSKALEYAHVTLETYSEQVDYLEFEQVNVVGDYHHKKARGLGKLFSVFVSKQRTPVTVAWFRSISHGYNHFLCKLSKLTGFRTKFVIPTVNNKPEYDENNQELLSQFYYELVAKFTKDAKALSSITPEGIPSHLLVGYNFTEDHNYMIDGKAIDYSECEAYKELPTEVASYYQSIISVNPEFWSANNLIELYSDFRLPTSLEPASYLSEANTDLDALFGDKLHTMDSYLIGFNLRLNALHTTDADYDKFKNDEYVLSRLINELTVGADISYTDFKSNDNSANDSTSI